MVRAADDIDAPSGFAEFAPVSSKISTASHGRVPAQADVSVLRADLADRLGDLCNGLNVRDAVSGLAFVRWSRDREDDWYTCDVALEVLPGELVGVGDAIVLESWPVACAQIGRDHLMLRNSRMPIEKNPWAVRVRSPSGGASDGVFYVFVGRHGIETVSGARLLLNLSGQPAVADLIFFISPLCFLFLALISLLGFPFLNGESGRTEVANDRPSARRHPI